jgi:ADP-ribose pyrophosphatase YjhB (NUDIX family)
MLFNLRLLSGKTGPTLGWTSRAYGSNPVQLIVGVLLERLPSIAPQLNVVEKAMIENMAKLEKSRSLFSDHEMRHFEDLRRAKRLASGKDVDEKDMEAATKQTAQDFEDTSNQELKKMSFSLLTPEDAAGDKKSLNRSQDKRLLLVSKMTSGQKFRWLFPQTEVEEGHTLRQAAEKAMQPILGTEPSLKLMFLGNAPSSVYSYQYPLPLKERLNNGKVGADIFFFKAQVMSGALDPQKMDKKTVQDFLWLTRPECDQLFAQEKQKRYWNAAKSGLFLEDLPPNFVNNVLKMVKTKTLKKKEGVSNEQMASKQ